ncbi:MAG: hypothetical protein ACI9KE_004265 [Polyangiales bacterium]|jgi:hypothetical protein
MIRALLLMSMTVLASCGATAATTPAGESWNPMPDYLALEEGDEACQSDDQCGGGERCLPPESRCSEDAPTSTPLCPIGSMANQCMYCLQVCGEAALPCESGYLCHGGFCVSPLRCSMGTGS